MEIYWKWDADDSRDSYTLLGEIKLTDEIGHTIIDECTTVDVWVLALLDGLKKLDCNEESNIDLIVEPDTLEFIIQEGIKIIKYGDKEVVVSNCKESIDKLIQTCTLVLTDIKIHDGVKDIEAIRTIESVANYS